MLLRDPSSFVSSGFFGLYESERETIAMLYVQSHPIYTYDSVKLNPLLCRGPPEQWLRPISRAGQFGGGLIAKRRHRFFLCLFIHPFS